MKLVTHRFTSRVTEIHIELLIDMQVAGALVSDISAFQFLNLWNFSALMVHILIMNLFYFPMQIIGYHRVYIKCKDNKLHQLGCEISENYLHFDNTLQKLFFDCQSIDCPTT